MLVGQSATHRRLLERLRRIGANDAEILIQGATGVGKELYAHYAHASGPRASRAFVPVNCGAIPPALFENELFGHVAGAFTGAHGRNGLVEEAHSGTLFLDEVDALAPDSQVKLLRFLQNREFRRLGETRLRRVDVRIISATNHDLKRAVADGAFRSDLLFRLRVAPIFVPPLRERPADIECLLEHFTSACAGAYSLPAIELSASARRALVRYSWPGNVRELENCVRYLTCLELRRPVEVSDLELLGDLGDDLPDDAVSVAPEADFRSAKEQFERAYVERALRRALGNINYAARLAGKPRRAFYELMRRHQIDASRFRETDGPRAEG